MYIAYDNTTGIVTKISDSEIIAENDERVAESNSINEKLFNEHIIYVSEITFDGKISSFSSISKAFTTS